MADMPNAVLLVEKGIRDQSAFPLEKASCLLGSSADLDVVLDNPYVSRLHARIDAEGERYTIRDLQSKNGTLVNGHALDDRGRVLRDGDRVELAGGQVVLRFKERGGTLALDAVLGSSNPEVAVDYAAREVAVQGIKVLPPLSRKEFDVLGLLYERAGEACSRDEISTAGWPERSDGAVSDQEIDQCMRRLRLRIEPDASDPRYIVTVRGYGYKLSTE